MYSKTHGNGNFLQWNHILNKQFHRRIQYNNIYYFIDGVEDGNMPKTDIFSSRL